MTTLTREEANRKIQENLETVKQLLSDSETLAEEHKLSFSIHLGWRSNTFYGVDPDEEYYLDHPEDRPEGWEPSDGTTGWKNSSDWC